MTKLKRPTAGQPPKFSEESATVAIRVPKSKKEHYKRVFRAFVEAKEIKNVTELLQINT